jgi:iron complex transport system substrate-binding protein
MRALLLALLLGAATIAQARVVAVGGAVTEIVFALGAGDRLVATDSTSTYPESAKALPKVGYMRSLSAEGVLSMRPDQVLVTAEAGPPAALAQLRAAGVKVTTLDASHSIEGLRRNVRTVAAALGVSERGEALERRIADAWRETQAAVAAAPGKPRVLFVLAHGGRTQTMVSGTGTAADAMITLAGGVNPLAGVQGYKPLTAEGALGAAPDVILVTREGLDAFGGGRELLAHPGLALTPAGKAGRVVSFDALFLLGFGPRLPQAVRELAGAIHGR